MEFAPLPLADAISAIVRWMQVNLGGLFGAITTFLTLIDNALRGALAAIPVWLIVGAVVSLVAYRRRFLEAVALALALSVVANLGLWRAATDTLSLVAIASAISLLFGVPLGILIAESRAAKSAVTPVLDYMQTTPAFVYLIPAVLFFGIGTPPGVFATAAFALPPVARTLALGLEQVSPRAVEAGAAFGASRLQILTKIKLPLALPYFRVGLNQCIMMSLSMVVICSLIGARGLGVEVVTALTQMDLGKGIEAGVAVVLVAVVLDRIFVPAQKDK